MQDKLPLKGILLVSDMDGTLITENFEVPKRNREAIDRFVENGGLFSFATGRGVPASQDFTKLVRINAPAILYNGSAIYDFAKKEFLWYTELGDGVRELIAKVIKEFPDMGIEVLYRENLINVVRQNEYTQRHVERINGHYRYCPLEELPNGGLKVLFADEHKRLVGLKKFLDLIPGFHYTYSSGDFLEMLPDGVNKGTALIELGKILGIEIENTAGIGDYYNDYELIRMAGIGATVFEAPDDIKQISRFIAGPCKEGSVADFIDYLFKTRAYPEES